MKSAWQIAMEKADKLGKVSQDELNSIKYVPEGNRIASLFIMDEKSDLVLPLHCRVKTPAMTTCRPAREP